MVRLKVLRIGVDMTKTYFEPTKEEVIKALKRIYGYSISEALRYGPQERNEALIITLDYLKRQFEITDEDLE